MTFGEEDDLSPKIGGSKSIGVVVLEKMRVSKSSI